MDTEKKEQDVARFYRSRFVYINIPIGTYCNCDGCRLMRKEIEKNDGRMEDVERYCGRA